MGYLHFDFYNGAMSTDYNAGARAMPTSTPARGAASAVIGHGRSDFFLNGIHLNVIEAATDSHRNPGATCTRSTTWCARSSRPTPTSWCRRWPVTLRPAAFPCSGGRPWSRARTWCSIPTTGTWAASTGRSTGRTCRSRYVGAEMAAWPTSLPFTPVGTRRAVEIGLAR